VAPGRQRRQTSFWQYPSGCTHCSDVTKWPVASQRSTEALLAAQRTAPSVHGTTTTPESTGGGFGSQVPVSRSHRWPVAQSPSR